MAYPRAGHEKQIIDAEWLAMRLNLSGHVVAMANHKVGWLITPLHIIRDDDEMQRIFNNFVIGDYLHGADRNAHQLYKLVANSKMKLILVFGWNNCEEEKELLKQFIENEVMWVPPDM